MQRNSIILNEFETEFFYRPRGAGERKRTRRKLRKTKKGIRTERRKEERERKWREEEDREELVVRRGGGRSPGWTSHASRLVGCSVPLLIRR